MKKKEREKVKEGKKPYFLKKGDIIAMEEKEHKEELEKSGKMQKYLKKKSKKLALKEKKSKAWSTKDID